MLPAVGNDVLSANPNFEALYRDLCVNKLNANATTKVDPKVQKERNAFDEVSANVASKKTDDVDYHVVHDEGWCAEETDEETGTPRSAKRGNQTGYYQVLFGLSLVQERPVARRGVSCRLDCSHA